MSGRRWAEDIRSRKLNVPISSDYAADGIGLFTCEVVGTCRRVRRTRRSNGKARRVSMLMG